MKQKVAAYCRVSTDTDDQLNSLEYQTSYFNQLVESSPKYELHKVYADRGITGTSWNKRQEFKNMLYDAGLDIDIFKNELRLSVSNREPLFTRILVKDVSRFTRNINAMEIISKLKHKSVYVDFVTANLTTETLENDVLLGILMLLAEQESKDRSGKVLFGQRQGAEKGVIMTADKFYGYRYIKESNALVIVEEEAVIIRRMYDLYIEGNGFRRISEQLAMEGVSTRKGKEFSLQSIRRILSNPAYKGWLVRNKFTSPRVFSNRTTNALNPESDWIVHKDRIPAIVSEDVFDKVQKLKGEKVNHVNRNGIHRPRSEFAGLVICQKCGSSYTRNREPSTSRVFYNCGTKKRHGISFCDGPNVFEDEIRLALDFVTNADFKKRFIEHKEHIIQLLEEVVINPLRARIDSQSEREVIELQIKLSEQKERKQRLAELYISGKFEMGHLLGLTETLDKEIEVTTQELIDKSKTNGDILREVREVEAVIEDVRRLELTNDDIVSPINMVSKFVVQNNRDPKRRPHIIVFLKFTDIISKHVPGFRDAKYDDFNDIMSRFNVGGDFVQ